jgi:hypothetical protein
MTNKKIKAPEVETLGYKSFFPYFSLLKPYWVPFVGALFCGLIYGVSSGFGLPFMVDQVFPRFSPIRAQAPLLFRILNYFISSLGFPLFF